MKSLSNNSDVEALFDRFAKLKADTNPKWGILTAQNMLCHLHDAMVFAMNGPRVTELSKSPPMFVRDLYRLYLPWPKNAPAPKEMMVTQSMDLTADLDRLRETVITFQNSDQLEYAMHPFFGKLDGSAWAKVGWRHFDYHLRQFGC